MAAHTLRGSWTLGAVPCCSAAGAGPAEEEESWKHTRDRSELTGGSCLRKEKSMIRLESRVTCSPLTGLTLQPLKFSGSTCLGCLSITFFQLIEGSLAATDTLPEAASKCLPGAAWKVTLPACIWVGQHRTVFNMEEGSGGRPVFILRT